MTVCFCQEEMHRPYLVLCVLPDDEASSFLSRTYPLSSFQHLLPV